MLYFWYCFDDYLATVFDNPDLGTVPWWVPLVVMLCLSVFSYRPNTK